MSTLVVHLLFLVLLSIAFILIHATKTTSPSDSLVLSLTRSTSTREFPPAQTTRRRPTRIPYSQTLEDILTEIPDGFVMSLALGAPSQAVHRIFFDTGSDLAWVPCESPTNFHCIDCNNYKRDPSSIFNPKNSHCLKRESCSSPLCVNVHSSDNYYDTCTITGCSLGSIVNHTCARSCPSFAYTYGDGAVAGILISDILDTNDHHSRSKNTTTTTYTSTPINITFGCVHSTFRQPMGVVGFGKGPLSLPSQLGFVSKGFSHCFLSFQFSSNLNVSTPLILGDEAISSNEPFQYTPMLNNHMYPYFYYVGLESITVGSTTTIHAPVILRKFNSSGHGGMLMDSGTTYTHLPEPFYWKLISTLESRVKHPRAKEIEENSPFDLCYTVPVEGNDTLALADDLPSITFHFSGDVSLALPQGNSFYKMRRPVNGSVVKCLLFQIMDDADPGCAAVFGTFQQHNVKVVYDLEKERVGFLTTDCLADAETHDLAK